MPSKRRHFPLYAKLQRGLNILRVFAVHALHLSSSFEVTRTWQIIFYLLFLSTYVQAVSATLPYVHLFFIPSPFHLLAYQSLEAAKVVIFFQGVRLTSASNAHNTPPVVYYARKMLVNKRCKIQYFFCY
jgi:hypothetical protein